jgi:hypothetical protein
MQPKRNYKIKFRISIGDDNSQKNSNFLKYYMPKWSNFMGRVMSRKLNSVPTEKTSSVKELPYLRNFITKKTKTVDLIELLTKKDPEMARLLLEVSPLFDAAPRDLKAHILATFGVTRDDLKDLLDI